LEFKTTQFKLGIHFHGLYCLTHTRKKVECHSLNFETSKTRVAYPTFKKFN